MAPRVQNKRTATPNNPPSSLLPGELAVEMATPNRLWVGVPYEIDASGRRLLYDAATHVTKAYVDAAIYDLQLQLNNKVTRSGDIMTGELQFQLPVGAIAWSVYTAGQTLNAICAGSGFAKFTGDVGIGAASDGSSPRIRFQDNGWHASAFSLVHQNTSGLFGLYNEQTGQYAALDQNGTWSMRVAQIDHNPLYAIHQTAGEFFISFPNGGYFKTNGARDLYWVAGSQPNFLSYGGTGNLAIFGPQATKATAGDWVAASDERVKTITGEYTAGLVEISQLQPVTYIFKGNETIEPLTDGDEQYPPYIKSQHGRLAYENKEFIGLIAQPTEGPMPELVGKGEGYIDGEPVADLRSLDTTALVYALLNAVKALSARIDAMEAAR
jgi:hypothetical protein